MQIESLHSQFRRYCLLEEGLSIRTVDRVRSCFMTFLKRTDFVTIQDLTEEALRSFFLEALEVHQWSVSHYSNHHKYLKKFLSWCVKRGHINSNPILNISIPKKPKPLPRRLSQEQAEKILYSSFSFPWRYCFEQSRNHAIIATFLFTGIRLNELLSLEKTDLNLSTGELLIRNGKGAKDRWVPIHFKLLRILKGYIKEQSSQSSRFLFTGVRSEKPLRAKDVGRICKKISKFSGVNFTPHQLRHTFGSVSVEQGLDVVKLKEIMGHSSIQSTMIYLKMSAKNLKRSLDRLEMF